MEQDFSQLTHFSNLKKEAIDSFYWGSMRPESAAYFLLNSHSKALDNDLKTLPEEYKQEYAQKYEEKLRAIIAKNARVASPMVTGPARFPIAKNQRAIEALMKAENDLNEWRKKAQKQIEKAHINLLSEDEKSKEEYKKVFNALLRYLTPYQIREGGKYYFSDSNLVYKYLEKYALQGNAYIIEKALETIKEWEPKQKELCGKTTFSARHRVWNLPEIAKQHQQVVEKKKNAQNVEVKITDGHVALNYSEDRLQIIFDEKPDYDTRSKLKHSAYHWSPSNSVWQRKLTRAAVHDISRVLSEVDAKSVIDAYEGKRKDFMTIAEKDIFARNCMFELISEFKFEDEALDGTGATFRQQLKQFFAGIFEGNLIEITTPKKFLLDCGLPNLTIAIRKGTLERKITKHGISYNQIKNLDSDLNNALLVFRSMSVSGAFVIIIGKENEEGLLCCTVKKSDRAINKIIVNEITSIHGRNLNQLTKWIEDGYLVGSQLEKTKKIIGDSSFNCLQCDYLFSLLDTAILQQKTKTIK